MPKKLVKYATKTLRADNNPLFNESFVFDVSTVDLNKSQLRLKVRDRYDLSRYVHCESNVLRSAVTLGEAVISFVDLQLTVGRNAVDCRRKVIWCLLQPKLKEKMTVLHSISSTSYPVIHLSLDIVAVQWIVLYFYITLDHFNHYYSVIEVRDLYFQHL